MHIVQKFIVVAAVVSAVAHVATRQTEAAALPSAASTVIASDPDSVTATWTDMQRQAALSCDAEDIDACEGMPAGVVVTVTRQTPTVVARPHGGAAVRRHKLMFLPTELCVRRPMSDMSTSTP
jgi:hypothetical protein